jgi:hypothetical protein
VGIDEDVWAIDTSATAFYLDFKTGVITVSEVIATDDVIYSQTGDYKIAFAAEHDLSPTDVLTIDWPRTFAVQQNSACVISGLLTKTYKCVADASLNRVVVRDFLAEILPGGTAIAFTLKTTVKNPGDFEVPGILTFGTAASAGGLIDSGTFTYAGVFKPSYIEAFSADALNKTAGATPVTYTFTLRPHTRVATGAYLIMDIPADIRVESAAAMIRQCPKGPVTGFSSNYISCSYNSRTRQVEVKGGFLAGPSTQDPPTLTWQIPFLVNPRSMTTTGQFNVTFYDSANRLLFFNNRTEGPTVTMTSYGAPGALSFSRSSETNGVPGNLTFQLAPYSTIEDGDQINLKLPWPVRFQ